MPGQNAHIDRPFSISPHQHVHNDNTLVLIVFFLFTDEALSKQAMAIQMLSHTALK